MCEFMDYIGTIIFLIFIQDSQLCDIYGYVCFEKYMKYTPNDWTCDCPMECTTISYSFSVVITPFNPEELCPDDSQDEYLMKPFKDAEIPPQFIRNLMKLKDNVIFPGVVEECINNLHNRAEVNFKLVTDTMPVTVMSRRLSFFDKMSAFGNN